MKISNLIIISIAFILLMFSITTYINYNQSEKVRENANYFTISSNFVRLVNQLQRNILNMERSLRGFLITGEDYLLQTYNSAKNENKTIFKELYHIHKELSPQREKVKEISDLYGQWITQFADPLREARIRSDSFSISSSLFEKRYMNEKVEKNEEAINKKLQQNFAELRELEYKNRENRRQILETSEQRTKNISFLLTILSIVTGFIIAFLLARHITARISKMVKLADSISAGNYEVKVLESGNDELSDLSRSLNNMADILAENIALLKRKNQELDQFAHIVSHDLKAPLRGIDNVVTWIEEDYAHDIPPKVNEYLLLVKTRIIRLENMIQGILTYARIGKEVQAKEEVNIKILLQEILENLPYKEGIQINIDPNLPVLYTDKVPLMQVFTNLVSNAIKYHDKKTGEVKIYFKEHYDYFEFFIKDDGPGIAASYHDKIFIIFQTLQERDSFESTGVGLAIVKKILVDRKEKINISSEPGVGSTFSFTWSKL